MSINEIVSLVLRVIAIIVMVFVLPYLRKKYGDDKINEVRNKIMTYVEAAEQIFNTDQGVLKKSWVQEKLKAAGIDVNLDIIDAEIESYVLILHNQLKDKE